MRLLRNKYNSKRNNGLIMTFSVFLLAFMIIFSTMSSNALAVDDSKNLGLKNITDPNYVWSVDFNSSGDLDSIKNSIGVRELNGDSLGKLVKVEVKPSDNDETFKIMPPAGGYELGKSYRITVGKGAKSKNNQNIKRDVLLDFKVTQEIKLDVNVLVSPYLSMLKQITVDCKVANVKMFKIEGNNNLFSIEKEAVTLFGGDTAKISFYDDNRNLLGESTVDVSKSNKAVISLK
ncbi:hypothetical protein [Clostridium lundense]|uniref:hypothetical protein n=1 Tax=Clostridium lundense TaxID=319475 RepID=UPI0004841F10|nr:hypothetical protein [Clostridium lundense]